MSFVKVEVQSGYHHSKPTDVWVNCRYIVTAYWKNFTSDGKEKKWLKVYLSEKDYVFVEGEDAQNVIDAMEAQI